VRPSSSVPSPAAITPPVQSAGAVGKPLVSAAGPAPDSAGKDSSRASGKDAMKEVAAKTKKGLGGLLRKKIP
jgi:hypothetical protein